MAKNNLLLIVAELQTAATVNHPLVSHLQRQYPRASGVLYSKAEILAAVKKSTVIEAKRRQELLNLLQVKPIRTQSGVATVTILTKPWPCPGRCIFCPADVRMPKSYLANEPGAQRAEANYFDPYLQVTNRLQTLQAMGHPLDKIELIILGGSWDSYPLAYQIWFIKRAFDAMSDFGAGQVQRRAVINFYQQLNRQLRAAQELYLSADAAENEQNWHQWQVKVDRGELTYNQLVEQCYLKTRREKLLAAVQTATWEELFAAQVVNSRGHCRNVGLVIETRPDLISEQTLTIHRQLGCTKIQIGVQTINEQVLTMNQRGTSRAQIATAFKLLRQFGFKIHAHFMANLYGSTPAQDIADYEEFVTNPDFLPDEIKLYPCSLLASAPLLDYYQRGVWRPYTEAELLQVLVANVAATPPYTRITRMVRDISANDIVVGNKKTNFRQLVDQEIKRQKIDVKEIRSREIRNQTVDPTTLRLDDYQYMTSTTTEHFLQWVTTDNKIVGFLRLSLPQTGESAMIREVHVYGIVSNLGEKGTSQHLGLGTKLVTKAKDLARAAGFHQLRVISAIGTRQYYQKLGFELDNLYQVCSL